MTKSVFRPGPPSMHAKGMPSSSIRSSSSPPSPTRTQAPASEPVPDRAVGVDADAVRCDAAGPDAAVRQAAVGADVERGEGSGKGLGDDERGAVRRDDHAVGERDPFCDPTDGAVGRDQRDCPRDALNGVPLRAAIYAQGQDEPVLELEADDVSYGEFDGWTFDVEPPEGRRVVDIDPVTVDRRGRATRVRGVEAVQRHLPFELSAPAELAGLPRTEVRLVNVDGSPGALSVYGEGMGAIVVLQHEAGPQDAGAGGLELPEINIDGATGTEIATPLGTVVRFQRPGVAYTVVGSVPPVAAENAARGL
jgi:hypothetical protein